MRKYSVYKHTASNGKVYIGATGRKPSNRWANGKAYVSCIVFNRAIEKYGWNDFKSEVLYSGLTKEEASEKEMELISLYNSTDSDYGYNIQNGGDGLGKHSEETKRKIGKANKGSLKWAKGRNFTKEHKERLRQSNLFAQPTSMAVAQINDKGEVVNEFYSLRDAERQTGTNRRGISYVLDGVYKQAGGYYWREVKK